MFQLLSNAGSKMECRGLQGSKEDMTSQRRQDSKEQLFCFQAETSFEGQYTQILEQCSSIMNSVLWF